MNDPDHISEYNSPEFGPTPRSIHESLEDVQAYRDDHNGELSLEGQSDTYGTMLSSAIMPDDTPATATPSEPVEDGMLPRDVQRKTAYYDYGEEKQMSQTDSKLFYQRSQLEAQKTGGSNWGSPISQQSSPVIMPRSLSNKFEPDQFEIQRTGSLKSMHRYLANDVLLQNFEAEKN
jgi:AMP deaminase